MKSAEKPATRSHDDARKAQQPVVLRIAIPTSGSQDYDYLSGDISIAALRRGQRVEVPFRRGRRTGIIVGERSESRVATNKLRTISKIIDPAPLFDDKLLEFLQRSARYYHHPTGEVLMTALPVHLRNGHAPEFAYEEFWSINHEHGDRAKRVERAPLQRELLALIQASADGCPATRLRKVSDGWRNAIRALQQKELVEQSFRLPLHAWEGEATTAPELNPEQQQACRAIRSRGMRFHVNVLDGITGSGKTEVYLDLIQYCLEQKKQVLMLVPEISLTPQLYARIASRVSGPVTVMHSGLNDNQRLNAWQAARTGASNVIIATRSGVFTPLRKPGLVIVDEEHDGSFKQGEGFRYHARDLAVLRAQTEDVPVVLGSATPSLETVFRVEEGHYHRCVLSKRAGPAKEPRLELIDLRAQKLFGPLSAPLIARMRERIEKDEQVLLFLNRRGYAPALLCHDCGHIFQCPACSANTTVHAKNNKLRCHHCGFVQPKPGACASCGSEKLLTTGSGTEQLDELVRQQFPDVPTIRIDRDTMTRKGQLQDTLQKVADNSYKIVIGTQLLSKGHDFPSLTLVALIDVDQGLYSVDFRATERLAQQITQVAGRAGRREQAGTVLIQTHRPDHPLFSLLIDQGITVFRQEELHLRKAAGLPPYSSIALVRASSRRPHAARELLAALDRALGERWNRDAGEWLGPVSAPLEKKAGRYRFQMLLQSGQRARLHTICAQSRQLLQQLDPRNKVRWSIDIDPIDLY